MVLLLDGQTEGAKLKTHVKFRQTFLTEHLFFFTNVGNRSHSCKFDGRVFVNASRTVKIPGNGPGGYNSFNT